MWSLTTGFIKKNFSVSREGWVIVLRATFNKITKLQNFSYIVEVSFIGRGNRSTLRKPMSCRKSLTNFIP